MRLSVYTRLDPGFALCRNLRTQVFVNEYNAPISQERDNQDYRAVHYLVRDHHNTPIGVARSHVEGDFCKIQRFALLPPYRQTDKLEQAFRLILNDCLTRYPYMPCNVYAQKHQEDFYKTFGFVPEGDTFLYADFVFRNMVLPYDERKAVNENTTDASLKGFKITQYAG